MSSDVLSRVQLLLENAEIESYRRYDGSHPLDLFLGIDEKGRKSLVVTLRASREIVTSSKTIAVDFFVRPDNRTSLRFSLEDDGLRDIFFKFCENMIDSTLNIDPSEGFTPLIKRWETWISFFQKTNLPLSESEILGLVGELYFLKNVMIAKYGQEAALESYIATDLAHKDFEIDDLWYEIKATHNGARTVKISSIQQLDSVKPGRLEVLSFDQGTSTQEDSITLNKILSSLKKSLDAKWQLLLDEKMRKVGYIEDERYDEFIYSFVNLDEFEVSGDFPVLRSSNLPLGITKASYEIDISAIQKYKVMQ